MEPDESVRIGQVLNEWLLRSGLLGSTARAELEEAWRRAAGDSVARATRVLGLRRNRLWVEVTSAPLRAELEGFRKPELLDRLQRLYQRKSISDIRFVVSGSL